MGVSDKCGCLADRIDAPVHTKTKFALLVNSDNSAIERYMYNDQAMSIAMGAR